MGSRATGRGKGKGRERERGVESAELKERLRQPRGLSSCHQQDAQEGYGPRQGQPLAWPGASEGQAKATKGTLGR